MTQPIVEDPARSLRLVVEGVVDLAKAEIKLGVSEAKLKATRVAVLAASCFAALVFGQVAWLVIAVSPLLFADRPAGVVVLTLGLALLPAVVAAIVAVVQLKALKAEPNLRSNSHPASLPVS